MKDHLRAVAWLLLEITLFLSGMALTVVALGTLGGLLTSSSP
jgi:hypothetical protein